MKACLRLFILGLFFTTFLITHSATAGGIHARGVGPDYPTERTDPVHPSLKVTMGTVELSGVINPGIPRVILRGTHDGRNISVNLPSEVFAKEQALDRITMPYAVGKDISVSGKEFLRETQGLTGGTRIMAEGAPPPVPGQEQTAQERIADVTLLVLNGDDNNVRIRMNYLFEGRPSYQASYTQLDFLVLASQLKKQWKGKVSGSGVLSKIEAEEEVDFLFQGEGMRGGQLIASFSAVPFASGKPLSLAKVSGGKTARACATNVPVEVTFGEEKRNRQANLTVLLREKDVGNDQVIADIEYEFNSIYPPQKVTVDLKSANLRPCDLLQINMEFALEAPAIITAPEPSLPEPAEPATPAEPTSTDDSETDTPTVEGDADTGTTIPFGSGDDLNQDDTGLITGNGQGINAIGGSGGTGCSLQAVASRSVDAWLILGLLGPALPMLRRFFS